MIIGQKHKEGGKGTIALVLRLTAGTILILLGAVGLVLPLMPGWLLIALGIVMVGPNTRMAKWITGMLAKARSRFGRRQHTPTGE